MITESVGPISFNALRAKYIEPANHIPPGAWPRVYSFVEMCWTWEFPEGWVEEEGVYTIIPQRVKRPKG